MASFTPEEYERAFRNLDLKNQRIESSPPVRHRLGRFTIVCLLLNRTIGSGIFTIPSKVLGGTGSVGPALLLWTLGGFIMLCGLFVWLELGLSVPIRTLPGTDQKKSMPRSGGEKNFLEFIFPKPPFLTTSIYGTIFILLGNISGNAIAFAIYAMEAAGYNQPDTEKPKVIGIAFVALTAAVLLHVCSRRGGIIMNNMFACLKVLLLLAIIILGFAKASGKRLGGSPRATPNFNQDKSFSGARQDPASYTDSLVFICYAYAGFDQPFYVLSESKSPRGRFPKYTVLAMSIAICLYVLVNVAYLCAVPEDHVMKELLQPGQRDMATMFFGEIFGNDQAKRVMSGLIAFSILGNIVVTTFTAARVKQEIAKEGIIPFSLFFATGNTSLYALLKAKFKGSVQKKEYMEQTPTAALALHWVTSVILIAVTAMLRPTTAYSTLVTLYSYVIVILVGFFVSGGLLYLTYFSPSTNWRRIANFRPWGSPIYALIYFVACGYLLFAVFAKPSEGSPFSRANSDIEWYIIPAIGLSSLAWGVCWYLGLRLDLWLKREELKVRRVPVIVQDDEDPDQWVQECELIDHERRTLVSPHFDPEN